MQEKINDIARRIKELREISDISIHEISGKLHISDEQYSNYERAIDDIPASLLCEIASIFHVEVGVLLTGNEPKMKIFTVCRKDKGIDVERRKQYKYQSLAANFLNNKAEPFIVTVEPKADDEISLNSHPGQEFTYLLEGRLKIIINNNEISLEEGDSIYFDSAYEHAMMALDGKPAKFLALVV